MMICYLCVVQTVGVPEVDLAMPGALLQRLSCQHHLCAVASTQRTDSVRISACKDSCDSPQPAPWQCMVLASCNEDCRQVLEERWHQLVLVALAREADARPLTWHLLQLPLGLLADLWILLAHLGMPVKEQNCSLSVCGLD